MLDFGGVSISTSWFLDLMAAKRVMLPNSQRLRSTWNWPIDKKPITLPTHRFSGRYFHFCKKCQKKKHWKNSRKQKVCCWTCFETLIVSTHITLKGQQEFAKMQFSAAGKLTCWMENTPRFNRNSPSKNSHFPARLLPEDWRFDDVHVDRLEVYLMAPALQFSKNWCFGNSVASSILAWDQRLIWLWLAMWFRDHVL